MKNTALWLLVICLVFAGFAGGFFLGRNANHSDVQHSQIPAATTPEDTGKLNINTATASQLEALPGLGPVLAQRIVAYRQAHGLFTTAEQLLLVEGIGDGLLEILSDYITTGG